MRILKIVLFLFLSINAFGQNHFVVGSEVRSFKVEKLDIYKNKYMSVFYVSARPASFGIEGQFAKVRKVLKGPIQYKIGLNGEVNVASQFVPKDGWSKYNYLLFVIHSQPKYALKNIDGTYPIIFDTKNEVEATSSSTKMLYRKSISVIDFNGLGDSFRLY